MIEVELSADAAVSSLLQDYVSAHQRPTPSMTMEGFSLITIYRATLMRLWVLGST